MTRSTRVAVTSPGIDPMEMWRVMATILRAPEQYRFKVTETGIHADLCQGLVALMSLDFAPGNVLIPAKGCDEHQHPQLAHYLMADFDTAYGATDPCGCRSGGIHVRLVSALGNWLDQHGATWEWYDESGDGWRHGPNWGTLTSRNEACPTHSAIPAPTRRIPPEGD